MTLTAQQQTQEENDQAQDQGETPRVDVADYTDARLGGMTKADLRRLAGGLDLPATGTRAQILKGLIALKRGGDRKHVDGKTLCPMCRRTATVRSTAGGIRYMRCTHCGYRFTRAIGR